MFGQSPLLKAVPDWSNNMAPRPRATRRAAPAAEEPVAPEPDQKTAQETAAQDRKACLVCGAATVMPESSYCFTHYQPEEPEAQGQGQPAQDTQEQPEAAQEAPGAAQPFDAVFDAGRPEAPEAAQKPQEAPGAAQPFDAVFDAGQPEEPEVAASGPPEPSDGDGSISRALAQQYRREVETGRSTRGRTLSQEELQERVSKLRCRVQVMGARYRAAELARIGEVEKRFLGHLAAAAESVNAHTTAAVAPLLARAEGRVPARRPGQTATERKQEIDQALVACRLLKEERKRLVEEERQERKAERAAKKARTT